MERSIQRNAETHLDAMLNYGRNERSIRHLHEMLAADLRATTAQ